MPKEHRPFRHSSSFYRTLKKVKKITFENNSKNNRTTIEIYNPDNEHIEIAEKTPEKIKKVVNSTLEATVDNLEIVEEKDEEIGEEIEESIDEQLSLLEDLRFWSLSNKITISAINDLLQILRSHGKTQLPKDGRTLLATPGSVNIMEMGAGKFWYNGIRQNLQNALFKIDMQVPSEISLIFSIDGFSPFNSSNWQFWPISFIIDELRNIPPMVAAVFYGESKPPLSLFFQKFVQELNEVILSGVVINNLKVSIKIKCFVCDTQARSFVKGR